jgi:hypothetical protein
MEHNNRDDLETIIDGALSSYSDVEPLVGLEERVLNRIYATRTSRRRSTLLRWALVLSLMTPLVFMAVSIRRKQDPVPKTGVVAGTASIGSPLRPAPLQETSPPEPRNTAVRGGRSTAVMQAHLPTYLPKQKEFPNPASITGEERTLLSFVERHPREAQNTFAELQKRNNEPIDIQVIQIPPLKSNGER